MKTCATCVILGLIWIYAVRCVPVFRSPVGLTAYPDTASAEDHIAGKDEPTLERNLRQLLPTDQGNVDLGVLVTDEQNKERYVRESTVSKALAPLMATAGCELMKPGYLNGNCEMVGDQAINQAEPLCQEAVKNLTIACAALLRDSGAADLKHEVQSGF